MNQNSWITDDRYPRYLVFSPVLVNLHNNFITICNLQKMMFIKKHQQHIFPVSLKDSKTTCVQCYNTIVTFKTITKGHECVKFISLKQNKTYLKGNFQSIWKIISMNIIRSIKIYDKSTFVS